MNIKTKVKSDLSKIIKHFKAHGVWVFIGRIYFMIVTLLISVILARLLQVEEYGEYKYFIAVFSIVASLSLPETTQVIIRYIPQGYDYIIRNIVRLRLMVSGLGMLFFFILAFFNLGNTNYVSMYICLGLLFPFHYSFQSFEAILQSKLQFKKLNLILAIRVTFRLIIIIGVYLITNSIYVTLCASLLIVSIINFLSFKHILKFDVKKEKSERTHLLPNYKGESVKLSIIGVLPVIATELDKVLIARYINVDSLGIFSIGVLLGTSVNGFFKPFMASINAKLVHKKLLVRHYLMLLLVGSIIGMTLSFFIGDIIHQLYGSDYSNGESYAVIILLSMGLYLMHTAFYSNKLFNKNSKLNVVYINNIIVPTCLILYTISVVVSIPNEKMVLMLLAMIYPIKLVLSMFVLFLSDKYTSK